jgi:hypothetical protein
MLNINAAPTAPNRQTARGGVQAVTSIYKSIADVAGTCTNLLGTSGGLLALDGLTVDLSLTCIMGFSKIFASFKNRGISHRPTLCLIRKAISRCQTKTHMQIDVTDTFGNALCCNTSQQRQKACIIVS